MRDLLKQATKGMSYQKRILEGKRTYVVGEHMSLRPFAPLRSLVVPPSWQSTPPAAKRYLDRLSISALAICRSLKWAAVEIVESLKPETFSIPILVT